jgi:hypothetical protein
MSLLIHESLAPQVEHTSANAHVIITKTKTSCIAVKKSDEIAFVKNAESVIEKKTETYA